MPYFPALNEVRRQAEDVEPKYPEEADDMRYLILYPEDYEGYGVDVEDNLALLVDEDNAREIKRLAEDIIEELSEGEK
jgi:hypothetical protein